MSASGHRKRGSHARGSGRRPPTEALVLLDYPDENELVGKPIAAVDPPRQTERRGGRVVAVAAGVVVAMGSIIGGSVALDSGGGTASTLRAPAPGPLIVPKLESTSPSGASAGPARQSRRTSSASPRPSVSATAASQPTATPPGTTAVPPSTTDEPPSTTAVPPGATAVPPDMTAGPGQYRWPSASGPVAGYAGDPEGVDQRFGDPATHGFGSTSYISAPTFNNPYRQMWPAAPYERFTR